MITASISTASRTNLRGLMGLAATRTKQRFGLDPRNTAWSNDTSRFGHTMLEKFGWKPGMGLGMIPTESHKTHLKVSIKDDNLGLGAKIKRKERKDEFDNGECAGLDVFQRILGRLNGKEQAIADELDKQRVEKVLNGKWGVHFIKGAVLASTWDPETKRLKSYSNDKKRTSSDDLDDINEGKDAKRCKSSHKVRNENESSDSSGQDRNVKEKKEKKEKKGKKDKKDKKKEKSDNVKKEKREKKDKKEKKVKKEKKEKKEKKKEKSDNVKKALFLESSKTASVIPANVATRLSVRARHIRQKRAATMDPKALNEIFMITDN